MQMTEEADYRYKQRLVIVVVSYLLALVVVGFKADFQMQIEWLYLLVIVPGVLYTVVIPYLKNETLIFSGAVYEVKGDIDNFFRVILVFFSGVITFIFVFGKHG